MRSSSRLLGGAFFCAILFLSGCARPAGAPFGLDKLEPLSSLETEEALTALQKEAESVASFRLAGKLNVVAKGQKSQVAEAIVFERGGSLRAELFSGPTNTWSGIVVAQGNSILSYSAADRIGLRTSVSVCSVHTVLSVPLLPDEFGPWLVARPPHFAKTLVLQSRGFRTPESDIIVQLDLADGRQIELLAGGSLEKELSLRALDVRSLSDRALIFSSVFSKEGVAFVIPEQGLRGEFHITKKTLNPDLAAERERLFTFTFPNGTTIEESVSGHSIFCRR